MDDSGVFHRNEASGYFVYGGYVFFGDEKDHAKRQYHALVDKIKKKIHQNGELKAAFIQERKHKRALISVLSQYQKISLSIQISRVKDSILDDPSARTRYKDWAIKMLIKKVFKYFISEKIINPNEDIDLEINLDEQATKSNGLYSLKDGIYEEFCHGTNNFDYGITFEPILYGNLNLSVRYCDSKNNYLVQAADILANRIWNSYKVQNESLRNLENHFHKEFP